MQKFRDTTANYTDDTAVNETDINTSDFDSIGTNANKIARFLRTKMFGRDVRESLALWVLYTGKVSEFVLGQFKQFSANLEQRQKGLEVRQDNLGAKFDNVIADSTVDREVIDARYSEEYNTTFKTLCKRLDHLEGIVAKDVPSGFEVQIKHGLNHIPVEYSALYYEWALGSEPDGLGTAPDGTLGARNEEEVVIKIQNIDSNTAIIHMPSSYEMSNMTIEHDGGEYWYLGDGFKTIRIQLK